MICNVVKVIQPLKTKFPIPSTVKSYIQIRNIYDLEKQDKLPLSPIKQHTKKKVYPLWHKHEEYLNAITIEAPAHKPLFCNHRSVMRIGKFVPKIADSAFIAPSASVIGNVKINPFASIWYGVIVRGDYNRIEIGGFTNIQDGTVIHESFIPEGKDKFDGKTFIKNYVTIGHDCIIGACTIENEVFIGMGSIVGRGAVIERRSMLAMGSVVPPHTIIPKGQLWGGNPVRFFRDLTALEKESMIDIAIRYSNYGKDHKTYVLPSLYGTQYLDAQRLRREYKKTLPSEPAATAVEASEITA